MLVEHEYWFEKLSDTRRQESKNIVLENFAEIRGETALLELMQRLDEVNPKITEKNYFCALMGVALCYELGWNSGVTLQIISKGSLLQNIGLADVPSGEARDFLEFMKGRSKPVMTHPKKGYRLLGRHRFNEAVRQVVLQHHENFDGSGFPSKIKGNTIYPLARMISMLDEIAAIVVFNEEPPLKAIQSMLENRDLIRRVDPSFFKSFLQMFVKKD